MFHVTGQRSADHLSSLWECYSENRTWWWRYRMPSLSATHRTNALTVTVSFLFLQDPHHTLLRWLVGGLVSKSRFIKNSSEEKKTKHENCLTSGHPGQFLCFILSQTLPLSFSGLLFSPPHRLRGKTQRKQINNGNIVMRSLWMIQSPALKSHRCLKHFQMILRQ